MGGSSSGGHLAGDADGASLEGGDQEDLMGPMVPPGVSRTDFDGPPSPVATLPPAVLASSTVSMTTSIEASVATVAPPKPSRSIGATARRQASEYGPGQHVRPFFFIFISPACQVKLITPSR